MRSDGGGVSGRETPIDRNLWLWRALFKTDLILWTFISLQPIKPGKKKNTVIDPFTYCEWGLQIVWDKNRKVEWVKQHQLWLRPKHFFVRLDLLHKSINSFHILSFRIKIMSLFAHQDSHWMRPFTPQPTVTLVLLKTATLQAIMAQSNQPILANKTRAT